MPWLVGQPERVVTVNRRRTLDARRELAVAAAAGSGAPPDWHQERYGELAYAVAVTIAERVGTDVETLTEALLWDDDVQGWCWSEVHERCCEETREHDEDAWREGVGAVWSDRDRPDWMRVATWIRLRAIVRRGEWINRSETLDEIEHDAALEDEASDEATRRHMAECARGDVGGDFHSTP